MLGPHPDLVMVAVQHVGLLVVMQQGLSVQFAVQHVGLLVMMQQGLSVQFYQGIREICPSVLEL